MKLYKPYSNQQYAELAAYCNQHNSHIVDMGEYLESFANPSLTIEDQNKAIRQLRESLFIAEADPLKHDYDEAVARGNTEAAAELKERWLAQKDAIRAANPYITAATETEEVETIGEQ